MRISQIILTISALTLTNPHAVASEVTDGQVPIPSMDCIVEPSQVVELGTSVPGIIEEMLFEKNDFVEQGAIVSRLDSRLEIATLELASARAENSTSLNLRKENADFGLRTQNRNQQLFKDATISEQDMDKVRTETHIAQLQLRQEQENQRIAILEAERARQALKQRTVVSPLTGVIMEKYKEVGEYVEAEPVYRIANLDPLHVELIVPVRHLGDIERGMTARVEIDVNAEQNNRHIAVVKSVDKVADAASGTFGVLLTMPNSGFHIPGGMRCKLTFDVD